ncbi:MAG: QueT transporter family protein [Ruminococcaceae bacterium]|nr:QueT transporter family protein [Oscillospiraceae bacterium]
MKNKTALITRGAVIAALYILLSLVSRVFNLDSGVIQVRISEALCILPCFTPSAIWGLFAGCLLYNILTGAVIWDVIFGSIATLIGGYFTYLLRKKPILAILPPILSNTLIIPFVLSFAYNIEGAIWYFMLTVGLGEVISCGVLGLTLYAQLSKHRSIWEKS